LFAQYNYNVQVKAAEMDRACSAHGEEEKEIEKEVGEGRREEKCS
jgi:hypothetical protein